MQEYEDQSQNVRENADPGREYAAPGLEIQREQPRHYTPTPADQRQSRKNAQREKMLRTLLLSTAVVATAAVATGQLKPRKRFQDAARVAIVNMQCKRVGDKYELTYSDTSEYDPVERPEIPICPKTVSHEHWWSTTNGSARFRIELTFEELQEAIKNRIERKVKEAIDAGASEEEIEEIRNEEWDHVELVWIDEPSDTVWDDVQIIDRDELNDGNEIGGINRGFTITADKVTEGTTIYLRVIYLEGDGAYEDRYYYQFVGSGRTWTEYHLPAQLAEEENG